NLERGEVSKPHGRDQVRRVLGHPAPRRLDRWDRPRRLQLRHAHHRGGTCVRGSRSRRLRDREEKTTRLSRASAQAGARTAAPDSGPTCPTPTRIRATMAPKTKPPTWAKKATPPPFAAAPKSPKFASISW